MRENETSDQAYGRFLEESLDDLTERQKNDNLSGSSLERSIKQYRLKAYEHALEANSTMSQLDVFKPGEICLLCDSFHHMLTMTIIYL